MRKFLLVGAVIGLLLSILLAYGVTARSTSLKYVALGDSVAAGAGLPVGSGYNDELCGRSEQAYPRYVAAHLGTQATSYACTAAKVNDGLYDSQTRNNTELFPQLDRALAGKTPDVITLTIGANDARWTEFLKGCYTWSCGSTAETYTGKVLRTDLRAELYYALYKIKHASGSTPPQVLISGYYMPVADDVSCVATDEITAAEIAWLQTEHAALNKAIADTTSYFDFATYVPIDFSGHELCSSDPWVQGLGDAAPFHPTAEGQAAIGQSFVNALQ